MKNRKSQRPTNGQRRLAVSLTLGSLAASLWGAQVLASAYELENGVEGTDNDLVHTTQDSLPVREPYSLDLQPVPTIALSDRVAADTLEFETFSLDLEPVPTVAAPLIEEPTNIKSKSSGSKSN